jgi:uncharacterized protein involved in type VI secretion and phage assembly
LSLLDLLQSDEETRTNQISGVVIGIVTDNNDPEKLGRVKISFPWRGEDDQSHWARVSTLMAGNGRGTFFLPEVGDEVLVTFDRGNMRYPYVIGALWNGEDKPPEENADGKNNIRKITSRSGHEIVFTDDDEQQKETLEIHTKAGHKILLDDSSGQEKIEIQDKTGSNKIVIDSAQNSVAIESAMQLNIKANMVEIEGTSSLTVKSSGTLSLQASGTLTIQGTLVKIN